MDDASPVLQRLERLEKRNRLMAACIVLLSVALALTALRSKDDAKAGSVIPSGKTRTADELVVSRLVLRGEGDGEATLEFDTEGNPHLLMTRGKKRAYLSVKEPGLLLRGEDGRRGAFLGVEKDIAQLQLVGEDIINGIRLMVKQDGLAGLYVLDQKGRDRWTMEASEPTGAVMTNRDASGLVRTSLGVNPKGDPALLMQDSRGRRRCGLLLQADGTPLYLMEDEQNRARIQMTAKFDGSPVLNMFREDGGVSFEAP